jgi:hypothetical protein
VSFKQKLKTFFKTKDTTDASVEILKQFILPFSKQFKGRNTTIDDVLESFFNTHTRRFAMLVAKRDFKLPGRYFVAGSKSIEGTGPRAVKKGQKLLVVIDKKERQAKIETTFNGNYHCYLLKEFEFKTIAEWCDVLPA